MTVVAVIPARWASTRFPGKPLATIAGVPMVVRVARRVADAATVDEIVVATEDERVAEVCRTEGLRVELTADDHETGTDRVAEVAARVDADVIVNVQGDEPLIDPASIDAVVRRLVDSGAGVSTGYVEGSTAEQEASLSVVHLVPTLDGHVLSFSRLPVPAAFRADVRRNVHVGLYAFRPAALARFTRWQQGPVEQAESIELLRFLEHGERIACVPVSPGSIAVDHPEDVQRVEAVLRA